METSFAQAAQPAHTEPVPAREETPKTEPVSEKRLILSIQKKKKKKKNAAQNEQTPPRGRREVVERHDIRYRGPLSYRHMMILGWLCLILAQASFILSTAARFEPEMMKPFAGLISIGTFVGQLFMPFLLLANFSKILSSKQQFKSLLLRFGGLTVLMGLALPLVYEHYVKGIAGAAAQFEPNLGDKFLTLFNERVFSDGYFAYNIFIDLFLCTLFMFFLMYHFKRPVRKGWVVCFRLLAILPVAYELASIVLKTLCKNGTITLPLYASSFLTTKPPMIFAAFIALALFIKRRERIFMKHGRTYEEYGQFLETNANSLHFSVHACVTFIFAAVIDGLILFGLTVLLSAGDMLAAGEATDQAIQNSEMLNGIVNRTFQVALAAGFGESLVLLVFAPIVLLFSYNRTHKNTMIDAFIPLAAVGVIVALYLEAGFQVFLRLRDILIMYSQQLLEMGLTASGFADLDLAELGLTDEQMAELLMLLSQPAP
jgi:hypothetical protein